MGYTKVATGNRAQFTMPHYNGDGQKYYTMVALTSAVAKVTMQYVPTDSGYGCFAGAADLMRLCIPLETVASGEYVDCVIAGRITGVSVGASGKVASTAMSTFTKGDFVFYTDTGTFAAGLATWSSPAWVDGATAAGLDLQGAAGIALTSGETATFDLFLIEKQQGVLQAT
ncbi:hypothetical protein LCGC14_2888620 [marine sediment metagenome]|uniref:Uncharacterized protein n=1 Tax=marine sediment metagenome TaxID=412755 RepID=A0A0F9AP32_9ZZZZ